MRAHFIILALIISVSGCVDPFGSLTLIGGGGPGVSINSFSFSPSGIKSNQLTKLSLSIENFGDYSIENDGGMVYLFGLPFSADSPDDWEITDKSDSTDNIETFSLMAPQIQGTKRYAGGAAGFEWILRAPKNLPKDEIFSYTAQARVCYPYATKVWGRLEVVSEDAWLSNPPAEHAINTQQTQGPLKVDFISKQPLNVEIDENDAEIVKIKVRITNIGDGVVTTNDCSVFGSDSEDDDDTALNNLNLITSSTFGIGNCELNEDLYLKKGEIKETYLTCDSPSLGNNPIVTSDFSMELNYTYYSDRKTSISVTGTCEGACGGGTGGGGTTQVITLTDLCTKICGANKQISSDGNPYGICATEASSIVKYPGTTVDAYIQPLKNVNRVVLYTALGSGTATINSLNLHDAKVSHLKLEGLKLKDLDKVSSSVQYEKNSKTKKLDKIGIVKYLCSTMGDNVKITGSYSKDGDCTNKLPEFMLSELVDVNGAGGDKFKDNLIYGLQINSLFGRSVSEMTGGNLTYITMEDFKLTPLLDNGVLPSTNMEKFLNFTKCDSKNVITPYSDSVFCQCAADMQKKYSRFTGTVSDECTDACTKKINGAPYAKGGVCNSRDQLGMTQCEGTILRTYKGGETATTPSNACAPNVCACYDTKSISPTEAALLCE